MVIRETPSISASVSMKGIERFWATIRPITDLPAPIRPTNTRLRLPSTARAFWAREGTAAEVRRSLIVQYPFGQRYRQMDRQRQVIGGPKHPAGAALAHRHRIPHIVGAIRPAAFPKDISFDANPFPLPVHPRRHRRDRLWEHGRTGGTGRTARTRRDGAGAVRTPEPRTAAVRSAWPIPPMYRLNPSLK